MLQKNPDVSIILIGATDHTNGFNTMKVKKLVQCIRDVNENEGIKLGVSSIVDRSNKNLEKDIKEANMKLKFVDNQKHE